MSSAMPDRITWGRISSCYLPLTNPISDAKVLGAHSVRFAAATPRVASCTRPSTRCWPTPAPRSSAASVASSSRWASTDGAQDIARVRAVRQHLGEAVPIMVDANQQWDRPTAQRMCRVFESFKLVWIEEPLDAYDHEGHAALAGHFEWLEPLFNERIEIQAGRMLVPTRPGLGLSLSEQARLWTRESVEVGQRA